MYSYIRLICLKKSCIIKIFVQPFKTLQNNITIQHSAVQQQFNYRSWLAS